MSTEPEYTKLQLMASAWLEKFDPATKTMTLVATTPPGVKDLSELDCRLLVLPIAGTDPVQYEYSCLVENCLSDCILNRKQTIFGPVYWCECESSSKSAAGKSAKGKSASNAKKSSKSKASQKQQQEKKQKKKKQQR